MIITNDVISNFHYDPSSPKILKFGHAAIAEAKYCAIDSDGALVPSVIRGKQWYDDYRAKAEAKCEPFFTHLKRLFINDPRDVDVFLDYMAHKMQYPSVKPRWAIVIAGDEGVGKDSAIDACWQSYGLNYINNISPNDVMGSFNDYMRCMLLRISETSDLSESNKWAFNEKVKVIISGKPDRMQINPKYGAKYWCTLYNGTILSTNHLTTGLYIPEGDRRYYVIKCATWAELGLDISQKDEYFRSLFAWFSNKDDEGVNGYQRIGEYLYYLRDVSSFNVNLCPAPTAAKRETQGASNMAPDYFDDGLLAYSDFVDELSKNPPYGVPSISPNLLACDDDFKPLIVNCRMLRKLIIAERPELAKELTNNKLNYLLTTAGYARIMRSDTGTSKSEAWIARVSSGGASKATKETFYYLTSPNFDDPSKHKVDKKSLALALESSLKGLILAFAFADM